MKTFRMIPHILFAILLIMTAVWSVIDMRSEYSIAANSGDKFSLFISIAFIIRDFCAQRWFLAVYYIVLAEISLVALYLMALYRYGHISNKVGDIALIALVAVIIMQIAGAIVRIVNWCKKIN